MLAAETTTGSGCESRLLLDLIPNADVGLEQPVTRHIRGGGGERKWTEESPLVDLHGILAVAENDVVAIAISEVGDSGACFSGGRIDDPI